jgi:hypothetical protein
VISTLSAKAETLEKEKRMKPRVYLLIGLVVAALLVFASMALAGDEGAPHEQDGTTLADTVREATAGYQTVEAAQAAGYGLFMGCVSGQQEGAMGLHYANGDLVGDGLLDAMAPEAIIYEPRKNGAPKIVGVEYIVIAEAWHANNEMPPTLNGHVLHYVGSPNRYGMPAFYELHVWAWKDNPNGTFADWNPKVSCDTYTGEAQAH